MVRPVQTQVRTGLTLGLADILQARRIVLPVPGAPKRDVARRLLAGGVSTRFPASPLKLHPDETCFSDQELPNEGGVVER
jgi:6-phosphogluconolactonase/glucosamine-6-phosphate isomerase/deaminase